MLKEENRSGQIVQFYNCKILRNHCIFKEDLWVRNEKIVDPLPIFYDEKVCADIRINCKGALIVPGYIDIQINGGFGIDFSTSDSIEAGIDKVAMGLLQYGVTSFSPTLITSPPHTYKERIPLIRKRNGSKNGAGILGIHLEGPFINRMKKGVHPEQYIKELKSGSKDILDMYGSNLQDVALFTLAPEQDPEGEAIKYLVKKGITVSVGHSEANLKVGEQAMRNGANLVTHLFNAMPTFHHRDPGLIGLLTSKVLKEKSVYYSLIADGIHTHPAATRIAFRSNKNGLILVSDAMAGAGLKEGHYCIGEQKIDVKDERAVLSGTNTLGGSTCMLDFCVRKLKESTGCSTEDAIECATLHPAEMLNISDRKGTLRFGSDADFIILDDNLFVLSTYIAGECVWERNVQ